jgi:hypothetical protein
VSPLAWLVTDLLLGATVVLAAACALRFARRPSRLSLERLDLVHAGLAIGSCLAMLVSIRFLWMAVFPLLYLLRRLRRALAEHPAVAPRATAALAAVGVALALAEARVGAFPGLSGRVPQGPAAWLAKPYDDDQYFADAVRFLRESRLEGNGFNPYGMGGFLCWFAGPALRTFVDGSMNFPSDVFRDYTLVNAQRGAWPHETFLDVLDRRDVDVFLGVGVPMQGSRSARPTALYTAANLERAPGWVLVSRSYRHAVYVRAGERGLANRQRAAAWYARQGVPFHLERGLPVAAVIRERPDWAEAHGLLPRGASALREAARSADPERRFRALGSLALPLALVGAYEQQLTLDREATRLRPDAEAPLRRLVYGLLRLDRAEEAHAVAQRLRALDPRDARSALFERIAARYLAQGWRRQSDLLAAPARDAPINALPLLRSGRPLRE